jgi:hypothetical protein
MNTMLKTLIFGLFTVSSAKFFFFSNLTALFGHFTSLKRVANPSLRTTGIIDQKEINNEKEMDKIRIYKYFVQSERLIINK